VFLLCDFILCVCNFFILNVSHSRFFNNELCFTTQEISDLLALIEAKGDNDGDGLKGRNKFFQEALKCMLRRIAFILFALIFYIVFRFWFCCLFYCLILLFCYLDLHVCYSRPSVRIPYYSSPIDIQAAVAK
jgi:hypothetical protein